MTVENCLHFLKMAEMYGLSDCKRETKSFILDNFIPVARNDDFRSISCDLFCEFLSDDRLRSQSELDVFKIALSWLETSMSPTRQAPETIRRVLGLVRYGLMSAEQMECIYSNPLLLGEACREVLQVSKSRCNKWPHNAVLPDVVYVTTDEDLPYMFYRCLFFLFFAFCFFSVRHNNTRQLFSGTAERIFMKLLPNNSGETEVCIAVPKWGLGPD